MKYRLVKNALGDYMVQRALTDSGVWNTSHQGLSLKDGKKKMDNIRECIKHEKAQTEIVEIIETIEED